MTLKFRNWFENEADQDFFHGSPMKFDKFDYTYIGKGNDQEGPGFYFSNKQQTAQGHASGPQGSVYRARLKLDKVVPLEGQINQHDITWMIQNAPNVKASLEDWGEEPSAALQAAIQSVMNYSTSPHDAFQNVWMDFYRRQGADAKYLQNMTKLGYDGVLVPQHDGSVHAVVFSPENISLLNNDQPMATSSQPQLQA